MFSHTLPTVNTKPSMLLFSEKWAINNCTVERADLPLNSTTICSECSGARPSERMMSLSSVGYTQVNSPQTPLTMDTTCLNCYRQDGDSDHWPVEHLDTGAVSYHSHFPFEQLNTSQGISLQVQYPHSLVQFLLFNFFYCLISSTV